MLLGPPMRCVCLCLYDSDQSSTHQQERCVKPTSLRPAENGNSIVRCKLKYVLVTIFNRQQAPRLSRSSAADNGPVCQAGSWIQFSKMWRRPEKPNGTIDLSQSLNDWVSDCAMPGQIKLQYYDSLITMEWCMIYKIKMLNKTIEEQGLLGKSRVGTRSEKSSVTFWESIIMLEICKNHP